MHILFENITNGYRNTLRGGIVKLEHLETTISSYVQEVSSYKIGHLGSNYLQTMANYHREKNKENKNYINALRAFGTALGAIPNSKAKVLGRAISGTTGAISNSPFIIKSEHADEIQLFFNF